MTTRALVLGGGGLAGIAWEAGLLAGLAAAGVDVAGADLLLGTSAGSVVATQLATGIDLPDIMARQVDPARQNRELAPSGRSHLALWEELTSATEEPADPAEERRARGRFALAADTVPEAERRAVIAARLPVHDWPARPLLVVAVEALTGETAVFDRGSDVDLVDAVAASCAVPGVWPPVTIGGTRYVDGGVRSLNNVDLAAGYDRVLVVAPVADPQTTTQVAELTGRGAHVEVVTPDERTAAIFAGDPLDPAVRTPAAHAGYAQAGATVAAARRWWG
ncbi:patatin-like phospholipase family protein [Actinophytocola sp. NPDC049390]|uniref:patatin-like phospholipase family protein n=1 Tax=Actinophytocola sp. NPDC049390 TaxID=3363894 RepID=UPI003790992F